MTEEKMGGQERKDMERRRDALMRQAMRLRKFLRGSLVQTKTRCGKPNCKCAKGYPHTVLHLSYNKGSKTRRVYLPWKMEGPARRWLANRRLLLELLEEVLDLNVGILQAKGREK
jgi:hypothetical protein